MTAHDDSSHDPAGAHTGQGAHPIDGHEAVAPETVPDAVRASETPTDAVANEAPAGEVGRDAAFDTQPLFGPGPGYGTGHGQSAPDQPPFGQAPQGQPGQGFGSSAYGQAYGPYAGAQQPYNQQPFGQSGQQQSGQPYAQFGQQPYGGQPYGQPQGPYEQTPRSHPWWYVGESGGDANAPSEPFLTPGPARSRRRGPLVAAGTAAVLALCGAAGYGGAALFDRQHAGESQSIAQAVTASTQGPPTQDLAKVAAAVIPSVVSVVVSGQGGSGEGSGIILSADGTILTNNHVAAEGANGGKIQVTFSNGQKAAATIVGLDATNDVAVIKAENVSGLVPAQLGDSDNVHVADTVLAIGSPLGLEGSVTAGIVSALHRPVQAGGSTTQTEVVSDAIQTDAPINPGNSGGALVDVNGKVIGMNTAIASLGSSLGGQSGSIGLGFAIPIKHASAIADQLIKHLKPVQPLLGVSLTANADATADGATVAKVTAGSGAEKAGIKVGDIITAVDGQHVADAVSLTSIIRSKAPGDVVSIDLTRNGKSMTVKATLQDASQTAS